MKQLKFGFLLCLVAKLFSCSTPTEPAMENSNTNDSIVCTQIVYAFSYDEEKEQGLSLTSNNEFKIIPRKKPLPRFFRECRNLLLERDKTIYFDGQQSITLQETAEYGLGVITTEIRDTSSWVTFHRTLPYLHFWDKYKNIEETVTEKSPEIEKVTFLEKKKHILNYECQQVMINYNSKLLICWFTKDLKLKDATKVVFQHDSIPGTILEWDEYWVGKDNWNYIGTRSIKVIKEAVIVSSTLFEIPPNLQRMDADEAGEQSFKRMVEASKKEKQLSDAEKNKYLGIWHLKIDDYGVQLEIKKLENNQCEVTETEIEANRLILNTTKKAAFYGKWLVVLGEPYWIRYKLTTDGKIQQEGYPFFTYTNMDLTSNN